MELVNHRRLGMELVNHRRLGEGVHGLHPIKSVLKED
jgi:hypothetical protein